MAIRNDKTLYMRKHNSCPVDAFLCDKKGPHFAYLKCIKHNKQIQWLNEADYKAVKALTTGLKNDPSVTETNNAK